VDLPEPGQLPRILVVDRTRPVVRVLAAFLDPHVVEVATSGADALARLAASPLIDAVLRDLYLDRLDPPRRAPSLPLGQRPLPSTLSIFESARRMSILPRE
jgi:CheY-like chemotaxis protein